MDIAVQCCEENQEITIGKIYRAAVFCSLKYQTKSTYSAFYKLKPIGLLTY